MNLKTRLKNASEKYNIKWETVEQDYALSWALKGISLVPELQNNIVFKGGTALKKVYFGNYRFSQDLDFSVKDRGEGIGDLESLVEQACLHATQEVQNLGENVEIRS